MIPVTLQITNFLSYGATAQTIDFSTYKLICLSGKNGHGKSALLDAITWVVWGQARKIGAQSKPDEGLLRLGTTTMCVAFDFIFNNQHYRIKREYCKKHGKATTYLDFGMLDDNNKYIPLTDKTIRATQDKIEQTLGLDYDTFINSSFLRQGQANEFSKKSPKERKEIVTTILGLAHFDNAKKYVLEKIRTNTIEKSHLEKMALHLQQEADSFALLPEQEQRYEQSLLNLKEQELFLREKMNLFIIHAEDHAKKKQAFDSLAKKITELKTLHTEQKDALTTTVSSWKKTHRFLLTLPDKKKLEQEKNEIIDRIAQRQQKQHAYLTKKEELISLKEQITARQKELSAVHDTNITLFKEKKLLIHGEVQTIEKQLNELIEEQKIALHQRTLLETTITQLRMTIPAPYLIKDLEELQNLFEKHKMLYQKWVEQGNWVHAHLKELATKKLLNNQAEAPCCPLCEQSLSQTRKRFLLNKFDQESILATHRLNRLKKAIDLLKTTLSEEHKNIQSMNTLTTHEKEIKHLEQRTHGLLKQKHTELIAQKTNNLQSLTTLEEQLQQALILHTTNIQNDNLLQELAARQKEAEEYLISTKIQTEEHIKDTQQLAFIEAGLQQHATLESTIAAQQEKKTIVHGLCTHLKKTVSQLKECEQQYPTLHTDLQKEDTLLNQEKNTLDLLQKDIVQTKEIIANLTGTIALQQQKKLALETTLKKNNQELHHCITTIHDDTIIATALGKDGIQALLIEDALPEIEEEANELLARLTDNQTHISIESLRDLKKGGTKETLDINISDAQGVRPYEMFSGGEAFRIDFALRIALSKLLARRAGTSLQTLIIDEGFGSQDEEGLSRIMDALYAIQNDFEKIIIVSHLPSMKDQFPVHFIAHKDQNGSKITIVEQG